MPRTFIRIDYDKNRNLIYPMIPLPLQREEQFSLICRSIKTLESIRDLMDKNGIDIHSAMRIIFKF